MSANSQSGKDIPQPASNNHRKADPREIALKHAEILQHRKNMEAQILDSLLVLSSYPLVRTKGHSAANPAAQDISDFKHRIRLFQPSDYDELIQERNANNLCGYTLCPRPKQEATPGGTWKLLNMGKKNFDIVNRKDHERWCSQICAKRAFYIKVQLNETAAWEREDLPSVNFELYEESNTSEARDAKDLERQQDDGRRAAELALERGDGSDKKGLVSVAIRPKEARPLGSEQPKVSFDDDSHLRVEGYKPKTEDNSVADR